MEALLKELPGVEIDDEGKFQSTEKKSTKFWSMETIFDTDGSIALENLPAEIINKVQVTDKNQKRRTFGARASSNNATINLTIDEDKNRESCLKPWLDMVLMIGMNRVLC